MQNKGIIFVCSKIIIPNHKIMKINKLNIYTFIILFITFSFAESKSQQAYDLCKDMLLKCKEINTLAFAFKKQERVNGKMNSDKSTVKMQQNPLKIYYKQEYPKAGLELLFIAGKNNNQALINPNSFPWVNVNLDPYGSTMRDGQHHTVHKMGFMSMVNILEHIWAKYGDEAAKTMVKYEGETTWDGNACYKILMENTNFKYVNYTVKQGETLISIAEKNKLSEHMILEKNKLSSYTNVSAGKTILIPSDYAKKMELYLDKNRGIPLYIKVYDDIGLYEQYEYYNVKINPRFTPEEFTEDYDSYGF
jgi:outer membrane lipoprotein-sorting protein